jgi:hypothetical protein
MRDGCGVRDMRILLIAVAPEAVPPLPSPHHTSGDLTDSEVRFESGTVPQP